MSEKKLFKNIRKKKATKKIDITATKHFQVQLYKDDALNFKHQAAMKGLSLQEGLVEAISLQMKVWGLPPCGDPGTTKPKNKL
jgi:hypothetical protein